MFIMLQNVIYQVILRCENGDLIRNNSIVEFVYDKDDEPLQDGNL